MKKHKELVIAWLNGAKIQYRHNGCGWTDIDEPNWIENMEYQVKPSYTEEVKIKAVEGAYCGGCIFEDQMVCGSLITTMELLGLPSCREEAIHYETN